PALTNGGLNLHSPVKRKLETEKDYVFDKRLRYSVRQNESNCRFRDIVVRKEEGFTHILLSSQTSDNNALTPEIMKEVRRALCNAATDDSKLLLLSAVGSVFCSGLDYSYLIGRLSSDRRKESTRIAEAISQEVMLRVKEMASCSAVVLEESKCLVRSFLKSVLEDVNEKECLMLKQLWSSSKGLDSLFSYLQDKIYEV
ncbi:hypothetical protein STEG23_024470, partial [Scotinomys teguina]